MPILPKEDIPLLQASKSAYEIAKTGILDLPLAEAQIIGVVGDVHCYATGSRLIDAALVCSVANGVILAFRGTLPPHLAMDGSERTPKQVASDWLHDFEAALVVGDNLPGRVHQGFLGALDALWTSVSEEVETRLGKIETNTKRLYITGHSKGGSVAHLAAARFASSAIVHGSDITVRTFEGAHAGDQAFADRYHLVVGDVIRYECRDDLIPHLPPSLMFRHMFHGEDFFKTFIAIDSRVDYAPAGELRFLDWAGNLQPQTIALSAERFAHMASAISTGKFGRIVTSHALENWDDPPPQTDDELE